MVRRISEKLKVDTDFIMNEFKTERKEVNIEEIVQKVSTKAKKNRNVKNNNSIKVIIFILISGILGLLASSLIFNNFSEQLQNPMPKEEVINKN